MNAQELMDEINRLARLCEAKDADNKLLRALHKKFIGSNKVLAEKLSEAQAQIAMQAEALNAVFNATPHGTHYCSPDMQLVKEALIATSESVAAWRAKETEPLRREVARLRDAIRRVTEANYEQSRYAVTLICQEALNDTQATSLAYDREVENRGAVKALEEIVRRFTNLEKYTPEKIAETSVIEELQNFLEELRAANKGEVK